MKFLITLTLLAGAVFAAPAALEERQLLGSTSNEFTQGGCKDLVMIYARASTEGGNLGSTVGPEMKTKLGRKVSSFAMEGIGGRDYTAGLADNFRPLGTTDAAIKAMAGMIQRVASQCPNAKIAVGGYSQGTAVAARGIATLDDGVRSRVNAVVLFGYTQNQQLKGGVPGMPQDRVKVFCATGDMVCSGTLTITLSHFTYTGADTTSATSFIVSKI